VDPGRAVQMVGGFLVSGLKVEEGFLVPPSAPSLASSIADMTYRFRFEDPGRSLAAAGRAADFMLLERCIAVRVKDGRTREFDVRASVAGASPQADGAVDVRVRYEATGSAKLAEIFGHVLGVPEADRGSVRVERVAVTFK